MNQTSARELNQSTLQNISCISSDSVLRTEDIYPCSKVKMPFSTIRLPSNDQFAKNKVLQLQEELLRMRKQLSQKECYFSKEKSGLMSRIQILTEENMEMKHRQHNLVQLNKTLQMAINSQEQAANKESQRDQSEGRQLRSQLQRKERANRDMSKTLEDYKNHARRLEQEKYSLLESRDRKIAQLTRQYKELMHQKDGQKRSIITLINSGHCSGELTRAISNVLHISMPEQQLSLEDIEAQSSYFEQSPVGRVQRRGRKRSDAFEHSTSRFTSRSFINQLHPNNPYINSECSEEQDEPERLLCEICRKVYEEDEFIRHMEQCQEIHQLHTQRQQLEKAIHNIDQQHRFSISQKKQKHNTTHNRSPLRPLIQNHHSKNNIQGRYQPYGNPQPGQGKKVQGRLPVGGQSINRYRSNKCI